MDTDYKVQVEHVSKAFKMYNTPMDKLKEAFSISGKVLHTEFFAVTDLSFQVKKGEILGIMGRNGSGNLRFSNDYWYNGTYFGKYPRIGQNFLPCLNWYGI